jgi:ribosomal-protein-alanine N-acetyltransferase
MSFPRIETARLMMRPVAADDVDDLHRLWTDPDVRKFLWDDRIIPRETAIGVIESSVESFKTNGFGFWNLYFKDDPKLVGFCGLRHFDDPRTESREVEILYGVVEELWGQGLATESAKAVLRFGFEQCQLERIYAGADPPNAASFRVMEKLGMKFARRATINSVEAIYYVVNREDYGSWYWGA